ncbi:Pollen Ole e 1 allergen/extensin [Melia azedarach]|uniref:Pollen Ole e 1 allergen/extensin n=1 Tax=Melia azedarach TaxID=155640 RepID=A0ACC1Y874_MELAZ|nr:Pollen Ole e 1 allergen/extensin [Melia azedarach]
MALHQRLITTRKPEDQQNYGYGDKSKPENHDTDKSKPDDYYSKSDVDQSKSEGKFKPENYGYGSTPDTDKSKPEDYYSKSEGKFKPENYGYGSTPNTEKSKPEDNEYISKPNIGNSKSENKSKPKNYGYGSTPKTDESNLDDNEYSSQPENDRHSPKPNPSKTIPGELGKSLPIGIQGLVLCESGPKYHPIQGAVARITCLAIDENQYQRIFLQL